MPRPPCIVCGKEGLQHYEKLDGCVDIWFCNYSCERLWQQNITMNARIADKRVQFARFAGASARIQPGQYKMTGKEAAELFKHQWPEAAQYMEQLQIHEETKQRIMASRVTKPAPAAVLAPEEVAKIKGVEMPKNDKKTCVVCNKHLTHNHPGAMFCSGSGGCGEKAANALLAIRKLQPVADRALRFLAGLNLQDHAVKEQREARDLVNLLVSTLRPKRGKL